MEVVSAVGVRTRCGPYTIGDVIGQGAQGTVHRGYRERKCGTREEVCLKLLGRAAADPKLRKAFASEIAIAARLDNPHVARFIEGDADDPEGGWIALELVRGANLRDVLQSQSKRQLPPTYAVLIAAKLCEAFVYLHDQKRGQKQEPIVHRDVSATNVLVEYDSGAVKLADFGLARIIRATHVQTTVGGTHHYMAPEQTRGHHADGRADLFSLGVLLYEMLAGFLPVEDISDAAIAARLAARDYPSLADARPDISAELSALVASLLEPDADRRCPNARTALRLLSSCATLGLDASLELGVLARNVVRSRIPTLPDEVAVPPRPHVVAVLSSLPVTLPSLPRLRRAFRPVRVWAATGIAALAVSFGAGLAWTRSDSRAVQRPAAHVPEPVAQLPPVQAPESGVQVVFTAAQRVPSFNDAAEQREPAPAPTVTTLPSLSDPAPSDSLIAMPASVPMPPRHFNKKAEHAEPGLLTIGAGTSEQVWVDRKSVGWSPIVQLPVAPGRHRVAIGADAPTAEKHVTVRSGEQQDVYFGD